MSKYADIAQNIINTVAYERDKAQKELSAEEFEDLDFSWDLGVEFDDDPHAFIMKYEAYLKSISPKDLDKFKEANVGKYN